MILAKDMCVCVCVEHTFAIERLERRDGISFRNSRNRDVRDSSASQRDAITFPQAVINIPSAQFLLNQFIVIGR